ncbi:fasciclin domain-containing protein [Chitinophaga sp.]|uniref:fasciclin domain-containing protein n=1 Tax=Chitinophaga sp. TaxID=1869181 RepID=UPI0031E35393
MIKPLHITAFLLCLCCSCNLAGLGLQEDYDFKPSIPDPAVKMTAWEFINQPRADTLFVKMLAGIRYAGLEEEYSKPGRTFILLTNKAIYEKSAAGVELATSYFVKNKVNGKPATRWEDYPVQQVRNLFLYHIMEGEYSYHNINTDTTVVNTLLPGTNVKFRILDYNDSKLTFNDFPGTKKGVQARTSNIRPLNGVIHVVDLYLEY